MIDWISVKDFLPGEDVFRCIVLAKSIHQAAGEEECFAFTANFDARADGQWSFYEPRAENFEVTHWIKMPSYKFIIS